MEVLSPSPPVLASPDLLFFLPSSSSSMALSSALESQNLTWNLAPSELGSSGGGPASVHVAVGRSLEKGKGLILWAIQCFGCREVVLVHIHKPSTTIPTMMGNFPASKASEEVVRGHRREERKQLRKAMQCYLEFCRKEQVKVRFLLIEREDVAGGLLQMVNKHTIKRLVMGTSFDNFKRIKMGFRKGSVTAKNAPPFCKIWFVKKGKHIWTRNASEDAVATEITPNRIETLSSSDAFPEPETLYFNTETGNAVSSSSSTASSTEEVNRMDEESDQREFLANVLGDEGPIDETDQISRVPPIATNTSFSLDAAKVRDIGYTPDDCSFNEMTTRDPTVHEGAPGEPVDCEELEREAAETAYREKSFQAAIMRERKINRRLEKILMSVRKQQEESSKERDKVVAELAKAMEAKAILEESFQKVVEHQGEVAEKLKLIQDSQVSLKIERYTIRRVREEAVRTHPSTDDGNRDEVASTSDEDFMELRLFDLQHATCDFSESFKIGHGSNGCVYKGELLNKSVAIKKLHPQSIQVMLEFEQEAFILGNLRHPHLVSVIGVCPEAWSLVSEYMPNGNLQDRFSQRSQLTSFWTWQERTVTASEIATAILFLHLSEPNEIIHGNLKPENIFFDSELRCKIGDFGIDRLVLEDSMRCPSFRRNSDSKGPFSYVPPEYYRTRRLTREGDVYSFGIIILQLLTGRPPAGLVGEVRRAMLEGRLSSVLDASAGEWPLSVATRFAEFGLQCCENNPRDRPELTDAVVRELKRLHIMEEQPVPHFFMCPILQELMHDPHLAADGYTYERHALRNWFESSHDTSPMTNLKLDNLNLTPNHALRIAINEWLSHSSSSSRQEFAGSKFP